MGTVRLLKLKAMATAKPPAEEKNARADLVVLHAVAEVAAGSECIRDEG